MGQDGAGTRSRAGWRAALSARPPVLKLFSDRRYLPPGVAPSVVLAPFWGAPAEDARHPATGRFDRYAQTGHTVFSLASLPEADVAVLPAAWEHLLSRDPDLKQTEQFLDLAAAAGKKTLVFYCSDSDDVAPYDGTLVFRTSLYRSTRRSHEFAMPVCSEDFVARYAGGCLPVRRKGTKPVVGFCGFAPAGDGIGSLSDRVKASMRPWKVVVSAAAIRTSALAHLARSPRVETNFIVRRSFLGGAMTRSGEPDWPRLTRVRQEYVRNMFASDYVLCARGEGNFSYRLYETLSCGRIPVFIDTDCVLPYDWRIDWRKYCVWVEAADVGRAAERVREFHDRLSARDFEQLQRECRQLWEDSLSLEGYLAQLHTHLAAPALARPIEGLAH
jgi:hypothetical protein